MYVLKLPMSQVMSNTSVKVFFGPNFCLGRGGGGATDLPVPLLRRLCFDRIG